MDDNTRDKEWCKGYIWGLVAGAAIIGLVLVLVSCTPMKHERTPDETEYEMLYGNDSSQVDSLGGYESRGGEQPSGNAWPKRVASLITQESDEGTRPTLSIPWPSTGPPIRVKMVWLWQTGIPWPDAPAMRIFELNMKPASIRHGQVDGNWLFWSFTSLRGVGVLEMMTGGTLPALPVTIIVRETRGKI